MDTPSILGFITLGLGFLGLAWQAWKSQSDGKTMREGVAKLAEVVASNQQVVQALVAEFGNNRALSAQQLALDQSKAKMDQLRMLGGVFRFLAERED